MKKKAGSRTATPGQALYLLCVSPRRLPARRRFFIRPHGPFVATAPGCPYQHVEQRQHHSRDTHDDQDQSDRGQRNPRNGRGDGVTEDRSYGDQE